MTTGYDRNGNRDNAAQGFQAQAEQISRRLGESAQTVWLAGLGALGRVQSEGGKLFDSLVREGAAYERTGQRKAAESVEELREEVETHFEQARDTAVRGWDKLGKAFDDRVKECCARLTSPNRKSWRTCVARLNP
ncbi:phasin family protein [Xanthomonas fragariae]